MKARVVHDEAAARFFTIENEGITYETTSRSTKAKILKKTGPAFLCGMPTLPLNLQTAEASSQATWLGKDGPITIGRSMDWPYDFNRNGKAVLHHGLNFQVMTNSPICDDAFKHAQAMVYLAP